jgi:hypothetical protein
LRIGHKDKSKKKYLDHVVATNTQEALAEEPVVKAAWKLEGLEVGSYATAARLRTYCTGNLVVREHIRKRKVPLLVRRLQVLGVP